MSSTAEKEQTRKLSFWQSLVLALDLFDLSAIFYTSGTAFIKVLFEQLLRYIFLPVAAGSAIIIAAIELRKYFLNKNDKHLLAKAILEIVGAAAITTAVVIALALPFVSTLVGPAIFAATFLAKALFHTISSIVFGVKSALETDPLKKYEFRKKAFESAIGAVVGFVGAAAVAGVLLLGKPAMMILGIFAGIFGGTAAVIKAIDFANPKPDVPPSTAGAAQQSISTDASLLQAMSNTSPAMFKVPEDVANTAPSVTVTTTAAPQKPVTDEKANSKKSLDDGYISPKPE